MPDFPPLRQLCWLRSGCHSSPGLKAWGFLAFHINQDFTGEKPGTPGGVRIPDLLIRIQMTQFNERHGHILVTISNINEKDKP